MKQTKKRIALLFSLILLVFLWSCSAPAEKPETQEAPVNSTESVKTTEETLTGLWADALYTKDTSLGNGAKTVTVEVKAEDRTVTFTVKTDKDTVGAALLEHALIAGEEGAYGLYVKKVNGITADFDVDQSYWAFYINGEMAMTGVDGTEISEGARYLLAYTK